MAEQPAPRGAAKKIPPASVVAPAEYTIVEVSAFQALHAGNATADQQRLALKWLIEVCARTYDLQYRPGQEGERDTTFALGMSYVGKQVVKLLHTNVESLRKRT